VRCASRCSFGWLSFASLGSIPLLEACPVHSRSFAYVLEVIEMTLQNCFFLHTARYQVFLQMLKPRKIHPGLALSDDDLRLESVGTVLS